MRYLSKKRYSGYSCCFRQWRATDTHCQYLHGYAVEIVITFIGDVDHRNWVYDFGGFKRSKMLIGGKFTPDQWLKFMFDHTVVLAEDDPELSRFCDLDTKGAIELRVTKQVGAEMFAKLVYDKLNPIIQKETKNRVSIYSVEFKENNNNSAIYKENDFYLDSINN